ncbi:MAG: hypothetical protein JNM31_13570 [Flavobacteriales bacterium]|nr:hypothetical protein [Flavobacteriales bacterium]
MRRSILQVVGGRSFRWLLGHGWLILLLVLSGCITIEENYSFRKDGSGQMEYVVDLTVMGEMMKDLGSMMGNEGKEKDKVSVSEFMDMSERIPALKKVGGVSKVKLKKEKSGHVQRVSFRFKDLNALNAALNVLMPDSTGNAHKFFAWDGETLVRTTNKGATTLGGDAPPDEEGEGADEVLKSMHYKFAFTFQSEIADASLPEGVQRSAPSPKQLRTDTDWSVIMRDPHALDFRITLAGR